MSFFFWLMVLLAAHQVRFQRNGYFADYIGPRAIQPIKGIFLILVFFRHFLQYVDLNGPWDVSFFEIDGFLRQLIVVPFLFYSGYGISESIRKKGHDYVKKLPRNRILKVLFQFDVAVLLYVVLRFVRSNPYGWKRVLLSLIGWDSVGNSNWYIFAIICLYLITWLSHMIFRRGNFMPALCVSVLTVGYILVMDRFKDGWWYNTVLAYVTGVWFSAYKTSFEKGVLSGEKAYYACLAVTVLLFAYLHQYVPGRLMAYELCSVLFAVLVVLFTAKVQISSRFLAYCGEHLFSLYILQRIPMIALSGTAVAQSPYLYFVVCFAITFLLSAVFDDLTARAWTALTSVPRKKKA